MIKTTKMLIEELSNTYRNPKIRIHTMVENGIITPIVRGVYETDSSTDKKLLAQYIYNPSYISFQYALSYYGLIPERVTAVTCATCNRKKRKIYTNQFGTYTYRDVPASAYIYDIEWYEENGYSYIMATPEKAVCDMLYTYSPLKNQKDIFSVLHEDLRIDFDDFINLDLSDIIELSDAYHTINHHLLKTYVRRVIRNACSNR